MQICVCVYVCVWFFLGEETRVNSDLSNDICPKKGVRPTAPTGEGTLFSMCNLFFEAISWDGIIYNKYKHKFLMLPFINWKLQGDY